MFPVSERKSPGESAGGRPGAAASRCSGARRTGRAGPGLTVRAIVDAAIELADADGIDAVSMRAIADRLGAGTMSLYTHVPASRC